MSKNKIFDPNIINAERKHKLKEKKINNLISNNTIRNSPKKLANFSTENL